MFACAGTPPNCDCHLPMLLDPTSVCYCSVRSMRSSSSDGFQPVTHPTTSGCEFLPLWRSNLFHWRFACFCSCCHFSVLHRKRDKNGAHTQDFWVSSQCLSKKKKKRIGGIKKKKLDSCIFFPESFSSSSVHHCKCQCQSMVSLSFSNSFRLFSPLWFYVLGFFYHPFLLPASMFDCMHFFFFEWVQLKCQAWQCQQVAVELLLWCRMRRTWRHEKIN